MADKYINELTELSGTPGGTLVLPIMDTDTKYITVNNLMKAGLQSVGNAKPANGRLTLQSGVPVSTSNQSDKTTLYFTPYMGNKIGLYDGSAAWDTLTFAQLSLNISAFTASKPYDIWIYNNAGSAALDSTVWTNGTTRATALAVQDGVYVKTGATTRRYLGTIYMDAAQKCQDNATQRYVWNYYNRINRRLGQASYISEHTYTTTAWRPWNNNTTIGQARVEFVCGISEEVFVIGSDIQNFNSASNGAGYVGFGFNRTNAIDTSYVYWDLFPSGARFYGVSSGDVLLPIAGLNYINGVEYGAAASFNYRAIRCFANIRM